MRRAKSHFKSDERILGDSEFVETVLSKAAEEMESRYKLEAMGFDFDSAVKRVADVLNLGADQILMPGKQPQRVLARSVLAYTAVRELGLSVTDVGKRLGLSQPVTSRAVKRGEQITKARAINLIKE